MGAKNRRKRNIRIPVSLSLALAVCLLCVSGVFYTPDNRLTDAFYQESRASGWEIRCSGPGE